jgi:hypothetical protein
MRRCRHAECEDRCRSCGRRSVPLRHEGRVCDLKRNKPRLFVPLGNIGQVGFVAKEMFIRRGIAWRFGESVIFEPEGELDSFAPEMLVKTGGWMIVQTCSRKWRLRDFCDAVIWGGVVVDSVSERFAERGVQAHRSAHQPHINSSFFFVISSCLLPPLFHPSRLDHRRKTNRERITFCPTLTAFRFLLFILFVFLFPLYFRQRR